LFTEIGFIGEKEKMRKMMVMIVGNILT